MTTLATILTVLLFLIIIVFLVFEFIITAYPYRYVDTYLVTIIDKWNDEKNYENVYKYKIKKNKLYLYTIGQEKYVFNLTYIVSYNIVEEII